jgi:GNAT superfamily N-acetyltransferase
MPAREQPPVSLVGYRPGFIGRITEVHAVYYHQNWGFDLSFESQVARELADFLSRLDPERDLFLVALAGGSFAGSVAVDGAGEQAARLRWFMVEPSLCGQGIGRALLEKARRFAQKAGYGELYLWTFAGLEAARRLYERAGFVLAEEHRLEKWGNVINEQKYVLRF